MDYIVHGVTKSQTWLNDLHYTSWKNCSVVQSCPILCDPMNCSPPGSSVHGNSPYGEYWSGLPCPFPGNLPNPGIESRSLDCRRTFYQLSQKESPHHLPEFAQVHVHCIGDAVQPSHSLISFSLSTFYLSQHQGLCQWVVCSHHITKILEFQLQHQSFQWYSELTLP